VSMQPGDEFGAGDGHEQWSELAAGYALSCLDEADEASYVEHAATCEQCRQLESDLADVVAELAFATPAFEPPASLKASIMRAVADNAASADAAVGITALGDPALGDPAVPPRAAPVSLADHRARKTARTGLLRPIWAAAAAVVVVVAVGTGLVIKGSTHATSVAAQCARVKCPTVQLTASGKSVATVMMLGGTAYVDAAGLPATPGDSSYVLWRISNGTPIAVASFSSTPTKGPVKAGPVDVPVSQVGELAISQEHGHVLPAAPTDVLAQGVVAS
jgi:hypothetical protein